MIKTSTTYRVLYADTDKMGYLYYGHYPRLYEVGRAEQTRELGLTYQMFEDQYQFMMPVASVACRYKKPAYYDDLLTVTSIVKEKPGRIIHYFHEVHNEAGDLLNTGEVKLFFVDRATNKSVTCPPVLMSKFESYF